jgi:hypothetical protein
MGENGQCRGPYYALSEEGGSGSEACLGDKFYQISKSTAHARAIWYVIIFYIKLKSEVLF